MGRVVRPLDQLNRQATQDTVCGGLRQSPVFGQQTRRFQRRHSAPGHTRSLEPHAQCEGAAPGTLPQFVQKLQGSLGVAVVQRPACRTQLYPFAGLGGPCLGRVLQRTVVVLLARCAVLQRMCRLSREQMRYGTQARGIYRLVTVILQ